MKLRIAALLCSLAIVLPAQAQLKDGALATIWYEAPKDSHIAVLRQAKWTLKR